jgi:DNA primase
MTNISISDMTLFFRANCTDCHKVFVPAGSTDLGGLSGPERCRILSRESHNIPEPDAEPEPDDTVGFSEPAEPDDQIKATLAEAAGFYNELLLSDPEKYSKVLTYLAHRGAEKSIIERFQIGYSPAYIDAEHQGRAL